jgi:peptide-methionine (R)-S-oxide reductase
MDIKARKVSPRSSHRRDFMKTLLWGWGLLNLSASGSFGKVFAATPVTKLTLSKEEWQKKLTPGQYNVLRQEGTEAPFTSPLLDEKREGVFACVACDLPLFSSNFKYDSKTGWPSFYDALPGSLETSTDYKLVAPRTEYHCARCGGHHGHVFNDGPKPTGLRYCNNGVALVFVPKSS